MALGSIVDPTLREKYDVRGPRYTSYPPATAFAPLRSTSELFARWRCQNELHEDPGLGLYIHVPFCSSRCLFCGCHTLVSTEASTKSHYAQALAREMGLVSQDHVNATRVVEQLAMGGGTPHSLPAGSLDLLLSTLHSQWTVQADAELSVEIDPRSISEEAMAVLLAHGLNRFSLGVQDFDHAVLEAIGRRRGGNSVTKVVSALRSRGIEEINFDLIYGLPGQSVESAKRTAARVLDLRPSRIATYGYAHVPWLRPHQMALEDEGLPSPQLKAELYVAFRDAFLEGGYLPLGMDHYALPDDPLALALKAKTLRRNFMGYTTGRGLDIFAFGASAISSVGPTYSQNHKDLDTYLKMVEQGRLPIQRGYLLTDEDVIRRELILELFCTFEADLMALSRRFDTDVTRLLANDLKRLEPMAKDGLVTWTDDEIRVTDQGRFFIRNLCMTFDQHLPRKSATPMYSRTV